MTESELLKEVKKLLVLYDWKYIHISDARRTDSEGYPDIHAFRHPRELYAELKTEQGTFTDMQKCWLSEVSLDDGHEVYVWRPSDLESIKLTLEGLPEDSQNIPSGVCPDTLLWVYFIFPACGYTRCM